MRRALLAALLTTSLLAPAFAATPPGQPEKGPGGADYPNETVVKRAVGSASAATFVFHAAGEASKARPVIIFLHSWGAANPQYYGGWIEHLARRGNLVLFPRFQEVNRTRPADATAMAATLVREALEALKDDKEAHPDPGRVAVVGHLAGAAIGLNLAIEAAEDGLPTPKLVFALMPGGIASDAKSRGILLEDLGKLDPDTLLITMSGDRDHLPTDRASRRILRETTGVPVNRKLFMRALSDSHGFPVTSATLASPGSPMPAYDAAGIKLPPDPPRDPKDKASRWKWTADMALTGEQTVLTGQLGANKTDTLDYLAYWKTFDLALEAAFAGRDAASLRSDPYLVDMGNWSDGWPMKRLSAEMPKGEGEPEKAQASPRRRIN
ncbi:chlorophyllase/cutinase-like alpha/beta fold protein [Microvirga massiliensis]|uniref:alpha/beta hydrolase fold domain-containing protein n=1 Tax=Microvirga massiliensis TaxID=1033741 RepID=UPI00062BAA44|nr:alpha/beta hydrolase fold domain-containing protein [Microvirga massiliensis]